LKNENNLDNLSKSPIREEPSRKSSIQEQVIINFDEWKNKANDFTPFFNKTNSI